MTSNLLGCGRGNASKLGVLLIDQHVPFESRRREGWNEKCDRSLFVVPAIAVLPAGRSVVGVPSWQTVRRELLDCNIRRNVQPREHERAWEPEHAQLRGFLDERGRVVFRSVDDEAAARVPTRAVGRAASVEQWMRP